MTIAVGDTIPDVTVQIPTPDGPKPAQTSDLLGKGRVVLFGVPGAFTPTCSDHHLPGFVLRADDLGAKGVDTIACMSVNDAFVMGAWGESQGVGESVVLIADGSAVFTKALGIELDLSGGGLGIRCRRFAAILEYGVVKELSLEQGGALEVSSADAVLAKL